MMHYHIKAIVMGAQHFSKINSIKFHATNMLALIFTVMAKKPMVWQRVRGKQHEVPPTVKTYTYSE